MLPFVKAIREKAQEYPQRIVFPEGVEERILMATRKLTSDNIAIPILIGPEKTIKRNAEKFGIHIDFSKVEIHDPATSKKTKEFAKAFYELRKSKGITEEDAAKAMQDINYFGTMMVHTDEVDGMVSGTTFSTADTIRPALQIIKTKKAFHKVSGVFFMVLEGRLLLFADCAITIDPNSHELKEIAIDTAETAKRFGIEPRIAMLSFSTGGSASHPNVSKVREAVKMVQYERPDILVEGEMQVDAALVPDVCERKFPSSKLKGDANVLIFPNLEAGNIAYKLVERLAGAKAIGPILQGMKKPVNDLSRGCSYKDIVNVTAFTVCEAQELDYNNLKLF
ncbi:MAG: phosphate acetyltransferase [Patescibacteria group bacterium]|nr:phosphate acetyltransferase [Patescibacteria group bacterium]